MEIDGGATYRNVLSSLREFHRAKSHCHLYSAQGVYLAHCPDEFCGPRSDNVRQPTASSATFQARIAASIGYPVSSRTIRRHLAEGHLGSRRPLCVLPLTPTHRHLSLEWCRAQGCWIAAEWNQVVFSDESRFNRSSDDNRARVWRPRGERFNPAIALQRHTTPTACVMVRGAIVYNTRLPLLLIRSTMTTQRYVRDILQPRVLLFMQRLPGAIFQQDNTRSQSMGVTRLSPHS
ncbi:transposable element Tcb2 transposase [Trichonephila clavipes]|nr:transposable element Tcb2 transposase [Trichonephila clavipes]